jgi:CoA:oxalate CoA-transferase
MNGMVRRPLEGVRVIGFEQQISAPLCTMILADHGAEVIKIERPGSGDPAREMAPIKRNEHGDSNSGYYLRFNRNKKSLTLNLQTEAGRKIYGELTRTADVVVENFKPGLADRLGIGYNQIRLNNPGVVYTCISGFGTMPDHKGEYSDRPAYDIIAQAMGGLMQTCGPDPAGAPFNLGVSIGDSVSGIWAAFATVTALFQRAATGLGQYVDIAMLDAMIGLSERAVMAFSLTGEVLTRGVERFVAPWGTFRCADGYVAIMCATEADWQKLVRAVQRPNLATHPELQSGPGRCAHRDLWEPQVKDWFSARTKQQVVESLLAEGLPAGPVHNSADLFSDGHVAAREIIQTIVDPVIGPYQMVGPVPKFSASRAALAPAPRLGQDTETILTGLGYREQEIGAFREQGVV